MERPVNKSYKYLNTQVQTASKEQLLILLFDGAIRFCENARRNIDEKDYELSYVELVRSQRIVMELLSAMDRHAMDPEVYKNLCGLYTFVYRELVEANMARESDHIDSALKILRHLRETWELAIVQMGKDGKLALTAAQTRHPESLGFYAEG